MNQLYLAHSLTANLIGAALDEGLPLKLKTYKLSGILENLDLRLPEAQQNQPAYSGFLAALLTNEMETKNTRMITLLAQ